MARHQGDSLPVSPRTLWRRLRDRGLLASWDSTRQRNAVRRTLEGTRDRDVLHLSADAIATGARPSEPPQRPANLPKRRKCGRFLRTVGWAESLDRPQKPSESPGKTESPDGSDFPIRGRRPARPIQKLLYRLPTHASTTRTITAIPVDLAITWVHGHGQGRRVGTPPKCTRRREQAKLGVLERCPRLQPNDQKLHRVVGPALVITWLTRKSRSAASFG